jgi:peptidoglycan lytic transglycosylase G
VNGPADKPPERTEEERERAREERAARRGATGESPAVPANGGLPGSWEEPGDPGEQPPGAREEPGDPAVQPTSAWEEPGDRGDESPEDEIPAGTKRVRAGSQLVTSAGAERRLPPRPGRAAPPPPKRHSRGPLLLILALVLLAAVVVAGWFAVSLFQPFHGDGDGRVAVTIPRGAGANQIGDILESKGVVDSGFFFSMRTRLSGKRGSLRSGRFVLRRNMPYGAAIDALTKAPASAPTINVTIPEGLSIREIAPRVRQAGLTGDYIAASRRSPLVNPRRYGAPSSTSTLEGFLFPATYQLRPRASVYRLVADQLKAFRRNFATVSLKKAKRKNLTPYDVLIIASMVEREARVAKERKVIAAVIYNRLKERIALGIDATTRYELNNWTRPLRKSELERPSPYNTRQRLGLPPTPIGNPGLASIEAAADPANVDYLYYVVKPCGNGTHAFSSTNAQFLRDVARYNEERAKRGGRDPSHC